MSVEIIERARFEKALSDFAPFGSKLVGAESGQFEYVIPIVSRIRCSCGQRFVPLAEFKKGRCPGCGLVKTLPVSMVQPGELLIKIYSSIDPRTGVSRGTGEDSIRLVLINKSGYPIAKKGYWITRLPGWEDRLRNKCRELWALALRAPRCRNGHKASLTKCKRGRNKGKYYWKCWKCKDWIGWEK